ncbi:MAG: DUF2807 domain-containing protein [Saprospiraceae bacterium]|nr:DUF2807 domain-containing protein [Saprospiraceae bacterium]
MRRLMVSFLFLGLFQLVQAQIGRNIVVGRDPVVSKTFNLGTFTSITSNTSVNVYLRQDGKQSVEAKGQQNIMDLLVLEVKDGTLKIDFQPNASFRTKEPVNLYIALAQLNTLVVSGSGNVKGESLFNASKQLDMVLSGSGNVMLRFEAQELRCAISGSGDANLTGDADKYMVAISGSGDFLLDGHPKNK